MCKSGNFLNNSKNFFANNLAAFALALTDKIEEAMSAETELSNSACAAIVQVGTEPGSSIQALSGMLARDHSSVVRLLAKLEKADLLVRVKQEHHDKRHVRVWLTLKGERTFTQILSARRKVLDEVIQDVDSDELALLHRLIAKLMPKIVRGGDDQHYVCRYCELEVCPQEICLVNLAQPDHFEMPEKPFVRKINSRVCGSHKPLS